jgi:hypothetical protein
VESQDLSLVVNRFKVSGSDFLITGGSQKGEGYGGTLPGKNGRAKGAQSPPAMPVKQGYEEF